MSRDSLIDNGQEHRFDEGGYIDRRTAVKLLIFGGASAYLGYELRGCVEDGSDGEVGDPRDTLLPTDKFERFIDDNTELAEELANNPDRPIPYEVFLAVAIHESDAGTSELARNATNYFGVIAKDGWEGAVYFKTTEEEVPSGTLEDLKKQYGATTQVLYDYGDGRIRVSYLRPFRQYGSVRASFIDFAEKLYYQEEDGSYRYGDVVEYLTDGGRNPYTVIDLMADKDDPDELQYATGREWLEGVKGYVPIIQDRTGKKSDDAELPKDVPKKEIPEKQDRIDVEAIDFSEFVQPREQELAETMKKAFEALDMEKYKQFLKDGIVPKAYDIQEILAGTGATAEYIQKKYFQPNISVEYIVWHLWANGVQNSGTPERGPSGTSHDITLSTQIQSWYNTGSGACVNALLSDNPDGELWQLTDKPFGRTAHVGYGIQDEGRNTHPDVNNSNSISLEVQANSVFDVSQKQFEQMILWTTRMLFESGRLKVGMVREDVNEVVNAAVIGHGKNEGIEFGYKYTRPMIEALQQFAYIAIEA